MKTQTLAAAVLGLLALCTPQTAQAQVYPYPPGGAYGNPYYQGPFGGGLFRGRGAYPYYPQTYLTTQPQLATAQAATVGGTDTVLTTGHPTRFLNYSHYFLNQGGGGLTTGQYSNPFSLGGTAGAVGPFGLGAGTFTPRFILGTQPRIGR